MIKCVCGQVMKETVEQCFFKEDCKGCGVCENGFVKIVSCENPDCTVCDVDVDFE
ncbi:hypothetical protein X915_gp130 [Bacillus phage vB_BanS-Tsamsa]|uniref:Uncharacterized protein n=1 Tax=Bacillus phage vB_BanS-Tsamsa TaxID=1308863 RepID=U5J9L6_9CAUD|nr:hypothetical protein X915_gp130 [Bacillus phage vB_BanS-Tsamsa]AGI11968.1 hypothetical protein [Bacillus phage vB_BanS-Tsamsa]